MATSTKVARLGTEKIGKLLWEMSSQTTFSLLVYAIYSITDTYFLPVGINSLAAAGASIISPVLIALGGIILVKLPVLLLAARLFALNGIWASEAISELILCVVALFMLKSYQQKIIAMEPLAYSP